MRKSTLMSGVVLLALLFLFSVQPTSAFQEPLPICTVSGSITQDTTWTADCLYRVDNHVTISPNATLTIQAGTIVKFAISRTFQVHGALQILGTSENPVYLTSIRDDTVGGDTNNDGRNTLPAPGNWGHVHFHNESIDSENLVEHAIVRYAGYSNYSLYFAAASPTIRDNAFENNNGQPLSADVYSFPIVNGNTFTNNSGNGMEIRGGTLNSSESATFHWSNTDVVYIVTDHISIGSNVTLVIAPNIVVKFQIGRALQVYGALQVLGTSENPVYFTSIRDDSIGGDTNNNGRNTLPAPGDWAHIHFLNESIDSENLIEYAMIRYAGSSNGAIYITAAAPTLRYNTIINNKYGIRNRSGAEPLLNCNDIYNNVGDGIYNENPQRNPVTNAQNHWWGDPSGPTHASNPGGMGQAVGDGVDFRPWSTYSCLGPAPTPTDTPTNTPNPTPTFTNTPIPTATSTSTPTPTPTHTATFTPTPTHTNTPPPPTATPAIRPTISWVEPTQGRADVPNELTIRGRNFASGAAVSLNSTVLTNTTFVNAQWLRAVVPVGMAARAYDLTVRNPDGGSATHQGGYTVFAAEDDDLSGDANQLWLDPVAPHAQSQLRMGLVVHRTGGKQPFPNVRVRFYLGNPNSGGAPLGDGLVPTLSPRDAEGSSEVMWTPPAAGDYEIYAVIDPDNAVAETLETNNTVHRTITVLPPLPDQAAPHVDGFTINDGAASTSQRTVLLDTEASDPPPGSGVAQLRFVEFEYSLGAERWIPVNASEWLDYASHRADHAWDLLPSVGVKVLQAWAADRDGNISLFPYKASINYVPATDTILRDQGRVYRYPLTPGQRLTARIEPVSGDPDLYIWAPDHATRPPWVSNLESGVDEVSLVAPVSGTYQVEVYGFTRAEYRLRVEVTDGVNAAAAVTTLSQEKPVPDRPLVPLNSEPGKEVAVPSAPVAQREVFLPVIRR